MLRARMVLAASLVVASLGAGGAGCGDNLPGAPAAGDLLDQLNALPGVTAVEQATSTPGFAYLVLRFTQPVDHAAPDGPTFEQRVSLLHRDPGAPMVVLTSGYWDYYLDSPVELTGMLGGNQISIEHRFFGESVPAGLAGPAAPAEIDWSKLTIEQMAHDQHAIIAALRTIYDGSFVTTGGSKGGMTAVFHRRFYPDDVDGTVPYVAPLSLGAPDLRYPPFVDTLGPATCRQAVRALAIELLANRRAAIEARTSAQASADDHQYTRSGLAPAVESAIVGLEWAFWQYFGQTWCDDVPAVTGSHDQLWQFLDQISPPRDSADANLARFTPYYLQAYAQLGFPDAGAAYLDPYLIYTDADYDGILPSDPPSYDGGAAMRDIDDWVQREGDRLLFVYGEWDPWTAGRFALGQATDSVQLVQAQGSHRARIRLLTEADEAVALDRLSAWTGVNAQRRAPAPAGAALEHRVPPAEPRVPPAMQRALRAR